LGLDIVEMVIEIETVFGVPIPDVDAARLRTVGDLYDYIVARLLPTDVGMGSGPYAGDLWERYLDVLEREIGTYRAELKPEARFVEDLRMD
jgi:acyl carrier protein